MAGDDDRELMRLQSAGAVIALARGGGGVGGGAAWKFNLLSR